MWQAIVIANQFTMKGDGIIHCPAAFPMIFTNARLNTKLAFNQVLQGMAFLLHFMMNAKTPIGARECVALELAAMIGDRLFSQPPT
jgi:hypothetical protein